MQTPSLKRLLSSKSALNFTSDFKKEIKSLQLKMLRIQQGVWHKKERVVVVFEGFDAAGKGGAIRKLTEALDPRSFRVHPIGPPTNEEQGKHWLYRFWSLLPARGSIAVFDRSWYGRVLVERVEGLAKKTDWKRAYTEINQFEKMLQNDGITVIKIFLAINKEEQLARFKNRLNDPYKQWKLTEQDIQARKLWDEYVSAVDDMFLKTSLKSSPWHLISADDKSHARKETLKVVTSNLNSSEAWMEEHAVRLGKRSLRAALKQLGQDEKEI
jgi:polyphosphate kinase 2 (PPK2 family)